MSLADLHDLAKKIHDYRELQRSQGFASGDEEIKLIANALLQAVREIDSLEQRISALEGKPPSNWDTTRPRAVTKEKGPPVRGKKPGQFAPFDRGGKRRRPRSSRKVSNIDQTAPARKHMLLLGCWGAEGAHVSNRSVLAIR
jgi:hypothetical protein